jgi:hypothetical protein
MSISDLPFAVLRFQYKLARLPLQLVENQVLNRAPAEAPARLFYERALGVLDSTVGNAIRDPALVERGAALMKRSETLGRAAKLDAQAETRKEQADAKLKQARDEAIGDQRDARAATEQQVAEARNTAEERKQEATRSAQQRSAAAKERADAVAGRRKEAVQSVQRKAEEKAKADEKSAAKAADAKLEDAEDKRGTARSKRVEANRLEDLATAEKESRRGSANGEG